MKYISAIIILFCVACSSPNKIPDDVLSIDKMKPIVWDMTRAGALAENSKLGIKDSAALHIRQEQNFQQVFAIYGITKDQFYKSYHYYLEHPDKNKILMDSVSAYANRQRKDLYKQYQ